MFYLIWASCKHFTLYLYLIYSARVPPGSECSWHITAPTNDQVIRIEFNIFKMAKNCRFHYVALYSSNDCAQENLTKANEVRDISNHCQMNYNPD